MSLRAPGLRAEAFTSPVRESLEDVGGVAGAVALSTVLGFALWLWTPLVLLAHDDWRELVPGALIGAALGEERTLERAA